MCRAATCRQCGKATWAGCGQHIDSVMDGVPSAQRCVCGPTPGRTAGARRRWSLFRR